MTQKLQQLRQNIAEKFRVFPRSIPRVSALLAVAGVIILTILLITKYHSKKTPNLVLKPTPATSQYLYQNKSKDFTVYLGSRSAKQSPEVKMAVGEASIDFKPEGNVSNQTKLVNQDEKSIVYKNIYPDVDLKYSLTDKGIKEEIILQHSSALDSASVRELTFKLNLTNAVPKKDPMGNLISTFVDPTSGNYLFHFEKPFMVDAGGNKSYQVKMTIVSDDNQNYGLQLEPDQGWLASAIFPVVIDPTIIHDEQSDFTNGQLNRVKDTGNWATGGTITYSGEYTIHTFTSSGTFIPSGTGNVEVLVVAGGGGGGSSIYGWGGGGGGGVIYNASMAVSSSTTVTVGAGGASGMAGQDSYFGAMRAFGGGPPGATPAGDGGSGGGGTHSGYSGQYGLTIQTSNNGGTGYGNNGGANLYSSPYWDGSGGGAGAAGTTSGAGGAGMAFSISGTSVYYAGGGGQSNNSGTTTSGGVGGGGAGVNGSVGIAGTPNTGGGGGGSKSSAGGGAGGSGIVIVRYPTTYSNIAPLIELYEQELTTDLNTVGLWHMNETAENSCSGGEDACDSSGNGNHGTATGTTITTTTQKLGAAGRTFNGTSDYVTKTSPSSALNVSNITLEAWIYVSSYVGTTYFYGIVGKTEGGTQGYYMIRLGDGTAAGKDKFDFAFQATDNSYPELYSTTRISAGQWYHVAATYDGASMKTYINGNLDTSQSETKAMKSNDRDLMIGRESIRYFTNGTIDEVRISNVARTAEEIKLDAQNRPYGVYTSSSIDLGTSVVSLDSLQWSETIPSSTAPSGAATTDIEFQTRTSANNSTWEEWKPTGVGSTAIDSMDSLSGWALPSSSIWSGVPISTAPETTIKIEGTGSMKTIVGTPLIDANTKGLWHFDETGVGTGSTAYDSSGNNNHGTATGTTLAEGFYGKARSFNGSSDFIAINDSTDLDLLGNNMTLSAWVYQTAACSSGECGIISKGRSTTYKYTLMINETVNTYAFKLYNGVSNPIVTGGTVEYNKWVHLIATWDGSNLRLYKDGSLVGGPTAAAISLDNSAENVVIGRRDADSGPYFSGKIDEPQILSAALTAEQIAEAYRAGRDHRIEKTLSSTDLSSKNKIPFYVASDQPGTYLETYLGETEHSVYQSDSNTRGFWHLDEKSGSGAYLKDLSGNSNHCTPTNATFTQGKVGSARSFNGSSAYLGCGTSATLEFTNAITLEAWIKTSTTTAIQTAVVQKMQLGSPYYGKELGINGDYVYFHAGGLYGSNALYGNIDVTDNQWHHIVGGYDGTNSFIYVDGQLDESTARTNNLGAAGEALEIGRSYNETRWFNGLIDEVRVSNMARSSTEILQAYQYGLRTHQITIDYSTGIGSSAPTSTSDVDFNPTTTTNLYVGDTVIVREKVGATTYIMQGEVSSISSGVVTVSSWSGTAPPSGYTTSANVFKWQREYWDITDISTGDRNAITKLGIRVLDTSKGFDAYFDDFRSNQNYLTTPAGSSITSTVQRYFQYRAILSTNDTSVTPSLTSVTLNYTTNNAPSAPTSLLTEEQTNPTGVGDTTPEFSAIYNDTDVGDTANAYQIQVDDDSGFGSPIWDSGASGTAMSNCIAGNRCSDISYGGSSLTGATTYYWRIKYWDDEPSEGAWSTESAYFTTSVAPTPPTSLLTEGQTNPTGVTDTTPEFSAIYNDDTGEIANYYRLQVDDDPAFGSTLWDSTKTSLSPTCTAGSRCADISYGGAATDLQWNTKYYWRIKYWDTSFGLEGAWSTESAYFTMSPIYEPTSCMIDDSGQTSQLIVKWNDNTTLETGYRLERSVDGGNWTLLSTEAVDAVSKTDTDVSSNHTYLYRIRANSDNGNSQWCATSQVDYSKGTYQMKGIELKGLTIE